MSGFPWGFAGGEGGSAATNAMVGAMAIGRPPRWLSAADMQGLGPIRNHGESVLLSAETPREMDLRALQETREGC